MPPDDLPLRDIHLPVPIGLWPLAPGWWGLILLGLGCLAFALLIYLRRRRMTPLKAALLALDRLMDEDKVSLAETSQGVSMLLKQLALTTHDRALVAALSGSAWIDWLDQRQSQRPLSPELRALLEVTPYAKPRALAASHSEPLKGELQTLIKALAKRERQVSSSARRLFRQKNPGPSAS